MNRLVSVNLEGVRPDRLPPVQAEGPVRVLFLTGSFLGFGTYHRQLLEYAGSRDDVDAVHIELKTSTWARVLGKSIRPLGRGVDQHAYRHLLMWRWVIRRWLRGPLSIDRFDVVHILTEGSALAICDFAGRSAAAFAVNIDATVSQFITTFGYRRWAMGPMLGAQQRIFDAADLVVGRNAWALESIEADFGVPPERCLLARNSLRPGPRSRADAPPRQPDEPLRIAFVGNAWIRKGGPELVRIHQERWADRAELHVFSSQAPPDASARNVVWHGRVARDELLGEYLPSMDIFVMPTREDMHPWAILEALSCGLPVVSSRLAGIPEMVRHGENGLLCEPGDMPAIGEAVASLLDDPVRCHEMGRAARRHVQTAYDPDVMFGGLMDRLVGLGHMARERGVRSGPGGPR